MKIAVIGTGMVGRAFAGQLSGSGHDVVIGTRDPRATLARIEPDDKGTPPFAEWLTAHPDARLVTMPEAGVHGEFFVNATAGANSISALEHIGVENLVGKVLLDLALPLDLSGGWPPRLHVVNDDSLGEQIQRAFPQARVVKSLNTVQYEIMLDPTRLPGHHTMFVSGNDAAAKDVVRQILSEFGWPLEEILDLGDITTARATEMYSRLQFTIAAHFGDYQFNIALVRPSN